MVTNPEGDWEEVVVCFRRPDGDRSLAPTGDRTGAHADL